MRSHRQYAGIVFPLIYALIGCGASFLLLKHNYFIETDGCIYAISARNLLELHWYPLTYFPPFYPMLIAGAYSLIGQLQLAAHLVSVIAWALSIFIFFKLADYLYGRKAAHIATFLYLSHGLALGYSYRIQTHSVDLLLILGYIFLAILFIRKESRRWPRAVLIGAILAAAILNRPEHILVALFLVPTISIFLKTDWLRKTGLMLSLIGVMGVLLYPYARFLHKHTGRWALTVKTANLRNFETLRKDGQSYGRQWINKGFRDFDLKQYFFKNKQKVIMKYAEGLGMMFIQLVKILYYGLGLLLAIWGCARILLIRRRHPQEIILMLCLLPLILIVPFSKFTHRCYLAYLPVFILMIALGIIALSDSLASRWDGSKRNRASVVIAVLFLLSCVNIGYIISHRVLNIRDRADEHTQMGLWMKKNIPDVEDALMASVKPFVAFHANSHFTSPPAAQDYEKFLRLMKADQIKYLIADKRFFVPAFPHFEFLMEEKAGHPGLKAIHVIRAPIKIILYRIL